MSLHLVVWNTLATVKLCQTFLDLGKKHEALDRVIDRCVFRQLANRFDHPLAREAVWHTVDSAPVDYENPEQATFMCQAIGEADGSTRRGRRYDCSPTLTPPSGDDESPRRSARVKALRPPSAVRCAQP